MPLRMGRETPECGGEQRWNSGLQIVNTRLMSQLIGFWARSQLCVLWVRSFFTTFFRLVKSDVSLAHPHQTCPCPPRPATLPLSQSVRLSPGKSWRLWSASVFLLVRRQSKPNADLELFFFSFLFFFFCREATTHRNDANGLQGPATLCTLCLRVGLERRSAHGAISQEPGQLGVKGRIGWITIKQHWGRKVDALYFGGTWFHWSVVDTSKIEEKIYMRRIQSAFLLALGFRLSQAVWEKWQRLSKVFSI